MSGDAHLLPLLYQTAEQGGWNRGMRAISRALLPADVAAGPLLEIGCGGGEFSVALYREQPQLQLYGIDLHPLALPHAQQREPGLRLSQSDLHQLPFPSAAFATVIALDSFDQKGVDTRVALAESWRVLRPQGCLLVRVSAYPWLMGAHDVAFGTGQRFSYRHLLTLLQQSHFEVVRMTYANTLLALPVMSVRLLQRWQWLPFAAESYGAAVGARWLERILQVEACWLARRNFPFGISLYAIARKLVISGQ